jgi:hypothetical protein
MNRNTALLPDQIYRPSLVKPPIRATVLVRRRKPTATQATTADTDRTDVREASGHERADEPDDSVAADGTGDTRGSRHDGDTVSRPPAVVWDRGWSTLASCQDMGEGIRAGGAPGDERAAAFFDGYAWLKMPNQDATALYKLLAGDRRFTERLENWTRPGGWFAYCLLPTAYCLLPARRQRSVRGHPDLFPSRVDPEVHVMLDPSAAEP